MLFELNLQARQLRSSQEMPIEMELQGDGRMNLIVASARKESASSLHETDSFRFPVWRHATAFRIMLVWANFVDLLCSWVLGKTLIDGLRTSMHVTQLRHLDPIFAKEPFTAGLAGKRVLVACPLTDTVFMQYDKRKVIFPGPNFLQVFERDSVAVPQTMNNGKHVTHLGLRDWFEGLELVKKQIAERDYDSAVIGSGAYGPPRAAHVKKMGGRWEKSVELKRIPNEHRTRPSAHEEPELSQDAENGLSGDSAFYSEVSLMDFGPLGRNTESAEFAPFRKPHGFLFWLPEMSLPEKVDAWRA